MKKGKIAINTNDIIGLRSGKLEVISYLGYTYAETSGGSRLRHWYLCKCDCGNTHVVQRGPLKNNIARSCGCGKTYKNVNMNLMQEIQEEKSCAMLNCFYNDDFKCTSKNNISNPDLLDCCPCYDED